MIVRAAESQAATGSVSESVSVCASPAPADADSVSEAPWGTSDRTSQEPDGAGPTTYYTGPPERDAKNDREPGHVTVFKWERYLVRVFDTSFAV
eukprot:2408166-Rhodomonas_salina.1